MAGFSATKLYTPNLLSLATQLSDFPLDREFAFRASARSRTCGSEIELGVDLDASGRVSNVGMQVSACAVGQSSAALLALGARGRKPEEITFARSSIEEWLNTTNTGEKPLPDWPGFDALEPAREHTGRHGALLMAWTAMTQALSTCESSR